MRPELHYLVSAGDCRCGTSTVLQQLCAQMNVKKKSGIFNFKRRTERREELKQLCIQAFSNTILFGKLLHTSHTALEFRPSWAKWFISFYGVIKWLKGHFILHLLTFKHWWFCPCLMFDFLLKCFSKIYCITGENTEPRAETMCVQ